MKKHFQIKKLSEMIQKLQYSNINKRCFTQNDIRLLYGASFQSANSDYYFFNTFGKDFAGKFNEQRYKKMIECNDSPIDMRFMKDLSDEELREI